MTRKTITTFLAIALGSAGLAAAPAQARHGQDYGYGYNNGYGYQQAGYDDRRSWNNNRGGRNHRGWRGGKCDKGTGGTIIGAIAGGLLGHEVAGRRGDKTMGTIIGAGVGAVAGRAIDKSSGGNRC